MMSKYDYIVVEAENIRDLISKVDIACKDYWMPIGGVTISPLGARFYQAMRMEVE